uniref:Uncharacterized protein n=1 Tax=Fopius arisanus TaxID=64838 RepID=A0A0C9PUR2_9HYME
MRAIVFRIFISILLVTTVTCIEFNDKSALISEEPTNVSLKNRQSRTTFVKAILSNPKLSPTHVLAEKFAKEVLRSPRTQQTLKKLTEIKPSVEKRSTKRADHQGARHKKRKRKKHRHRSGGRRRHHHHSHHHRNNRRRRLERKVQGETTRREIFL